MKINLDLNQASEGQISDRSESRVLIATLNGMSKGKRSHIGFKNLFLDTNIFNNFEINKKKKIFLLKKLNHKLTPTLAGGLCEDHGP